MKKWPSLEKMRFSRKQVFWGLGGILILILVYPLGILPLVEAKRRAEEEIILKKKVLLKYVQYLENRKSIEEEYDRTIKQYEDIQKRLLPGDTPQLGAANLQEIVKRLSEKNGMGVRSFRILEPKEIDAYRKVSIQIEFNPNSSMLGIGQFIHDIEHQEKELMISEMDLLVLNPRMPNSIQGSLVISGLMKGTRVKEKGREK